MYNCCTYTLRKNKHEGKTINIWYMIGEGPKLGVDLL